ncbi:MAG: hypothetical protein ACKPFF_07535, partial [Planktothrix sp.]
ILVRKTMTTNINAYIVFVSATELDLYDCLTNVEDKKRLRKSWQQDFLQRYGEQHLKFYQDHFGLEVFDK